MIVERERPLPASALDACAVAPDDGTMGGYIAALERALSACAAEIEARLR